MSYHERNPTTEDQAVIQAVLRQCPPPDLLDKLEHVMRKQNVTVAELEDRLAYVKLKAEAEADAMHMTADSAGKAHERIFQALNWRWN